MSIFLALDSDRRSIATDPSHDFVIDFEPPIRLDNKPGCLWSLALINLKTWYSFYNISAPLYNNATFTFNGNTHTISPGVYNLFQMSAAMNALIQTTDPGFFISLVPNDPHLTVLVNVITAAGILNIDPLLPANAGSQLYKLLGFSDALAAVPMVGPSITEGDLVADVTNGIDVLYVNCNIVHGTYTGQTTGEVIFSFQPNKPPGRALDFTPINPLYLPIVEQSNYIRSIRLYITDNLGRPVDFNGETFSYILHCKLISLDCARA
jgi:hypothetical protein